MKIKFNERIHLLEIIPERGSHVLNMIYAGIVSKLFVKQEELNEWSAVEIRGPNGEFGHRIADDIDTTKDIELTNDELVRIRVLLKEQNEKQTLHRELTNVYTDLFAK